MLLVALSAPSAREVAWSDLAPPIQSMLARRGLDQALFPGYIAEVRERDRARVRDGDLDALVYYALQSPAFTRLPPIEPAMSAKAFVEHGSIPRAVQDRLGALVDALRPPAGDTRLNDFRAIVERERAGGTTPARLLDEQYARAMRSLYEKEFASAGDTYQRRGLSTDTSVEAGYGVYLGLGALRALEPQRRVQRVLIVGPGLDLAPRTGLVEAGDPQSWQPYAVIDALLTAGLADRATLAVLTLDINPRVSDWIVRARGTRPRLTLISSVAERAGVRFSDDYREYFSGVGRAVGGGSSADSDGGNRHRAGGLPSHLSKSIQLANGVTSTVEAITADIVVDRLDQRYDLTVVTNVFPYLSDRDLLLAISNIVAMLAPGGVLLHNEARPLVGEAMHALGLPLLHSRSAVIATVDGAKSPLYDAVWLHRLP